MKTSHPRIVGCFLNTLLLLAIICFFSLYVSFFPPTWHPHAISFWELGAGIIGSATFTFWAMLTMGRHYVQKEQQQKAQEQQAKS